MFYLILSEYFRQTAEVKGVGEFFALFRESIQIQDDRFVILPGPVSELPAAPRLPWPRDARERIDLLEKYRGQHFFKVMASHLYFDDLKRICETFSPIFVERRNLFEQFLSYMISRMTGQWYSSQGIQVPEESLDFDRKIADEWDIGYMKFLMIKREYPRHPVLVYEDFVQTYDYGQLLARLGLRQKIDLSKIATLRKQNPSSEGKLRYFKNPEELRSFYCHSYLNDIYPLP